MIELLQFVAQSLVLICVIILAAWFLGNVLKSSAKFANETQTVKKAKAKTKASIAKARRTTADFRQTFAEELTPRTEDVIVIRELTKKVPLPRRFVTATFKAWNRAVHGVID